jgi:hypothetical protein
VYRRPLAGAAIAFAFAARALNDLNHSVTTRPRAFVAPLLSQTALSGEVLQPGGGGGGAASSVLALALTASMLLPMHGYAALQPLRPEGPCLCHTSTTVLRVSHLFHHGRVVQNLRLRAHASVTPLRCRPPRISRNGHGRMLARSAYTRRTRTQKRDGAERRHRRWLLPTPAFAT